MLAGAKKKERAMLFSHGINPRTPGMKTPYLSGLKSPYFIGKA